MVEEKPIPKPTDNSDKYLHDLILSEGWVCADPESCKKNQQPHD